MSKSDVIKEAGEAIRRCEDNERENRDNWIADVKFVCNDEQWPELVLQERTNAGRPAHTINRLAPILRQVVNEARANKPSILVRPVDKGADPDTAEILGGLIRNIESVSGADIAYDTAVEHAVAGGFGYWRVDIDYAHNDTFDKDILIRRIANPLSVYGDPDSYAPDGEDWNLAFVTDYIRKDEFKRRFRDAEMLDFEGGETLETHHEGEDAGVRVAEYWTRETVSKPIVLLSDGQIMEAKEFTEQAEYFAQVLGIEVVGEREVMSYRTRHRLISGAEVLSDNDWAGCYIPIVPVIGSEVIIKDKRHLRGLFRGAKAAQERYNYWVSAMTELIALSPRVPYIAPSGAFKSDRENWDRSNKEDLATLEYDGPVMPQRQPPPQPSAGMLQEAMSAAEDIKAITGIYDASLGARSNEVSGVAINSRKRQGDISTFHFTDNQTRSIRQTGRILVDLIPKVYTQDRVVRVLGIDGKTEQVTLGEPNEQGRIYDLGAGKYDVTVKAGPNYATQREETRAELADIIGKMGEPAAQMLAPIYLRNCDWPGAEDVADRLEGKQPGEEDIPPQVRQQMQEMGAQIEQAGQQMQMGMARMQELEAENAALKAEHDLKAYELEIKNKEADIKAQDAQTKRIQVIAQANAAMMPQPQQESTPAPLYGLAG